MKVVLHKAYGGFHLTPEIAKELDMLEFDWDSFGNRPKKTFDDFLYTDYMDEFAFRSHPVFVQAVENLLKKLDDLDLNWIEKRNHYVNNLEVVEFNPKFEVVDYHDGKEKLMCNGNEVYI